jgi:hypothetical protein
LSGIFGSTTLTSAGSSDGYFLRLRDSMYLNACQPVDVEEISRPSVFLSDPVPNPSAGEATISYSLPNGVQNGMITVYTITGQILRSYPINSAANSLRINNAELAPGIYMYQLQTAQGASEVRKMCVVR